MNTKEMKGKYVIIDLRKMDYMKDKLGEIVYYDTAQEAREVCGMYEFDNVWVLELIFNHIESENLSFDECKECNGKMEPSKSLINEFGVTQELDENGNSKHYHENAFVDCMKCGDCGHSYRIK